MLQIFLTDLAAYNKGYLFGEWITLPCDDIDKRVSKVLRGGEAICAFSYGYEKHEEYFITDFEWDDIALYDIDEYSNIDLLNKELWDLQGSSKEELKAIRFLLQEGIASDLRDALSKIDDVVIHYDMDLKEYAYDLLDEIYEVYKLPSIIANHIDYDGVARDLMLDGKYYEVANDLYEYTG